MRRLLGLVLLLAGCAGTDAHALVRPPGPHGMLVRVYTDAQCQALLSARRTWAVVGAGAAFAGGAGGITTAFPESGTARYVVGGISLGVGVAGASMVALGTGDAEDFGRYCTTQPVHDTGDAGVRDVSDAGVRP